MEINENTMVGDVVETFETIDLMVPEFFDFRFFLRTCPECVVYGKINTLSITASKTVIILRYALRSGGVRASFRGRDVGSGFLKKYY